MIYEPFNLCIEIFVDVAPPRSHYIYLMRLHWLQRRMVEKFLELFDDYPGVYDYVADQFDMFVFTQQNEREIAL